MSPGTYSTWVSEGASATTTWGRSNTLHLMCGNAAAMAAAAPRSPPPTSTRESTPSKTSPHSPRKMGMRKRLSAASALLTTALRSIGVVVVALPDHLAVRHGERGRARRLVQPEPRYHPLDERGYEDGGWRLTPMNGARLAGAAASELSSRLTRRREAGVSP